MSDVLQKLLDEIPDTYQKTVGFPTWVILKAFALGIEQGMELISKSYTRLNPENLTGSDLDTYIYYRSDISRTQAVVAGGVVTVTGKGTVNIGDIFATDGGVRFISGEKVTVDGEADVLVSCEVAGTIGNVPAESVKVMPVTIAGISSCTNKQPITGGYDEETDEHLLERFVLALQQPATSGNQWQYAQWALSVDGVGDCKVFPLGHGNHTVDIVLLGSDGKPASDDVITNVQNYIDPDSTGEGNGIAPIGARCFVSPAVALEVNISLNVQMLSSGEQEAIKQAIQKAIESYFASIAFKQDYVSYARIGEAVLNAEGVLDYTDLQLNSTTGNLDVSERQVPILAGLDVTFDG